MNVPLLSDFAISGGTLETVNNVAVRVTLADGTTGWGETSILPPLTVETQSIALAAISEIAPALIGQSPGQWRSISEQLLDRLPAYPSVRAGIEMAVLEALTRYHQIPLYAFFGGAGTRLKTDITIPIGSAEHAFELAREYRQRGFDTLKVKIGRHADQDLQQVRAIRKGFPNCRLILDANGGFDADEAIALVQRLAAFDVRPVLIEQPVAKADLSGLRRVGDTTGIPVAADESCCSANDAIRIVEANAAQVINIKLVKCGVAEAMAIASVVRSAGLQLMIGGMVETRIGMGFAAHFAAGTGGFRWIDLDTPLLLADDPVSGGYTIEGAEYSLDASQPGHGGALKEPSSGR